MVHNKISKQFLLDLLDLISHLESVVIHVVVLLKFMAQKVLVKQHLPCMLLPKRKRKVAHVHILMLKMLWTQVMLKNWVLMLRI